MRIKLTYKGGPGSGHHGHSGRPGKVGGSAPSGMTMSKLQELSDVSLPPDDDNYEYFYHATRYPSYLDKIEQEGLKPGRAGNTFLSKDEIRDLGSGFVIVKVPKGQATEGIDVVEEGLSYREWTVKDTIPASNIVRVVREVPLKGTMHTVREDNLAKWALTHQGEDTSDLPEEYQSWFTINKQITLRIEEKGGAGSGHWGHAGRPSKRGGSLPGSVAMSRHTGKDAAMRRMLAKGYNDAALTNDEYDATKYCERWREKVTLNSSEHETVNEYTMSAYREMNGYLRHGAESRHVIDTYRARERIAEMDSVMEKSAAPENLIVVRETSLRTIGALNVGDEFIDKGYMSTTVRQDVLDDATYGTYGPDTPRARMYIAVPKGYPSFAPDGVSEYESEAEVILNRGSRFRVTGIETIFNQSTIYAEVVP